MVFFLRNPFFFPFEHLSGGKVAESLVKEIHKVRDELQTRQDAVLADFKRTVNSKIDLILEVTPLQTIPELMSYFFPLVPNIN